MRTSKSKFALGGLILLLALAVCSCGTSRGTQKKKKKYRFGSCTAHISHISNSVPSNRSCGSGYSVTDGLGLDCTTFRALV